MQPHPPPAPTAVVRPPSTTDPVRVVVGLLLVLPAGIGLLVGQVWPTIRTLVISFQERSFLPAGSAESAGFDNYADVVGRETFEAYGAAALLPLLPLVALLLVGPLLAYAAHRAGRATRWTTRLVLAVPMVCFAPTAISVAWVVEHGLGDGQARAALWLGTFGLVAGLGVTLFLAVLRGRTPGRSGWPAGVTAGAVAGIATVAVALQAFAYPILLGADTPVPLIYRIGFVLAAFGPAAAHGAVLFGVLLALGVGAALIMILSGLRLTIEPATRPAPGSGSAGAAVATGAGLLVVLAIAGYGLWTWLSRLGELDTGGDPSAVTVLVNTWLPPLLSSVVGVGLAAVAGFGIGALRPLGRWSELLLLPFAPWLFVGAGPLVVARFDAARDGLFGNRIDTFLGLVPPGWLVVPALFLFTLLFRGLSADAKAPASYRRMVVAALPMLVLAGAATWLVQSQSLLWSLVVGFSGGHLTGPVLATQQGTRLLADGALGLVLPLPAILVFAVGLGLLQLLYLDRLAIRTGRVGHNPD